MRRRPGKQRSLSAAASLAGLVLLCLGLILTPSGPGGLFGATPVSAATCPPVANTPTFTIAYGTVQLDEADAAAGTVVEALNPRGEVVGCFEVTVTAPGNYGAMFVYGEDTSVDPVLPGMRNGETVTFHVDGEEASANPELAWSDGTFNWVALAASSNPTSVECYGLDLDAKPPQAGSVVADPPATCLQSGLPGQHLAGTQVQLQASPATGFRFSHWSGDVRGNANPITLIMDRDRSFVANFVLLETDAIYLPLIRQGR